MKREKPQCFARLRSMSGYLMTSLAVGCFVYLSVRETRETQAQMLPSEEKTMIPDQKPSIPKKRRKKPFLIVLPALTIAAILLFFSLGIAQVNGKSMYPNFNNGDILVYSRLFKTIDYGDVIIFQKDHRDYVKRVFGKPGDTVSITDNGVVLVNHVPLIVEGLMVIGTTEPRELKDQELVLGKDEYFVLGDNRTVSLDSRNKEIGTVTKQEIVGVYLFGIKNG